VLSGRLFRIHRDRERERERERERGGETKVAALRDEVSQRDYCHIIDREPLLVDVYYRNMNERRHIVSAGSCLFRLIHFVAVVMGRKDRM